MGVGVDLDAVELPRPDAGQESVQAVLAGEDDCGLFLKILEPGQRDVKEVAGAAGGVEHLDAAQPVKKLVQDAFGFHAGLAQRGGAQWHGHLARGFHGRDAHATFLASRKEAFDRGPGLGPLAAQRGHDHGVDHEFDVLAAGEVRTELRTLGGVEAAFEKGAEDGGIDRAPI